MEIDQSLINRSALQPPRVHGYQETTKWASEFSQLSLETQASLHTPEAAVRQVLHRDQVAQFSPKDLGYQQAHRDVGYNALEASAAQHSQYYQYPYSHDHFSSPAGLYGTTPGQSRMSEHKQIHHQQDLNRQFDQAFDQVENALAREHSNQSTTEVTDHSLESSEESEDLSHVARGIVNSMASSKHDSGTMAEKLKNSQFLGLMSKLSQRQVVIEDDHFVDQTTRAKVEMINESDARSSPQQQQQQQSEPTKLEESPEFKSQSSRNLEDPFEYLEKTGMLSGGREQLGVNEFTPLKVAESLHQQVVHAGNWEENYDEED